MNPLEMKPLPNFSKQAEKLLERSKPKSELTPKPVPILKPVRFQFQKGMNIHIYGEHYRVIRLLNRGRVVLKHLGPWKGEVPK